MAEGLNGAFERFLLVNSTKTSGGGMDLVKHQFGVANFDPKTNTSKGLSIMDAAGIDSLTKWDKVVIKVGSSNQKTARSQSNKAQSTVPFAFSDVVGLDVTVPNQNGQTVDEVLLGYNGDPTTSMVFETGKRYVINIKLSGGIVNWLGYEGGCVSIPYLIDIPACPVNGCIDCDPCAPVDGTPYVLEAIENLRNHQLRGGVKTEDLVEITPVRTYNYQSTLTPIAHNFWTLSICDAGDGQALANIQSAYTGYNIVRTSRADGISTYQFIAPDSDDDPADYTTTIPSFLKDCEDCPAGTTEQAAGVQYIVTLEDDGVDSSASLELLPTAVAGSAVRLSGEGNFGTYQFLTSAVLSQGNIDGFITANPTGSITEGESVPATCNTAGETSFAWVESLACSAVEETYEIRLPDTKCGDSRLPELQAHYPNLTIASTGREEEACQGTYEATIKSNLVCTECSAVFLDYFKTEAPSSFQNRQWVNTTEYTASEDPTTDYVGIKVKGKVIENCPDECLIDEQGFVRDSVKVQISGGYTTAVSENYSTTTEPFHAEQLALATVDTQRGGNFLQALREGRFFFTGEERSGDYQTRKFKDSGYDIDICGAYITYGLTVSRTLTSQGFGDASGRNLIQYNFIVPFGRQAEIESLLNTIAVKAGLKPVVAVA